MLHRALSHRLLGGASLLALLSALLGSPALMAQGGNAQDEAVKQTSRLISNAIARRIVEEAVAAEVRNVSPGDDVINGWATLLYTNITDGGDDPDVDFEANLVDGILGGDKRVGDWFLGLSGSVAHADIDIGGGSADDEGVEAYTVSPYLGYVITKSLFANAILGYSYVDADTNAEVLFTEIGLNALHIIDDRHILKGNMAHRYQHGELTEGEDEGESVAINTFVLGAEYGYRMDRLTPFVRGQFEVFTVSGDTAGDNQVFFVSAGFEYELSPISSFGAHAQVETINDEVDIVSGVLEYRQRF